MTLDPKIMSTVEQLDYRVTVGDVSARAGLDIDTTQRGLLALASEVSGNLQVSDSGEIAYLFPENFRSVLRDKYLRLRLQAMWASVWAVLFYLIRISFGIMLLLSILLIVVAIAAIFLALQSSQQDDRRRSSFGGSMFVPRFWFGPDLFWFFNPSYGRARRQQLRGSEQMNFFEAIFSFLFGDGNPNANLEDRRWQEIATVIRNNRGAVVAEQIAPYLDLFEKPRDDEYYMVPVLSRFNGQPEVSPNGEIIYRFPDLQSTATQSGQQSVAAFLREFPWPFSQASSNQRAWAIGLGTFNFVGAVLLWYMLGDGTIALQLGGLVAFAQSIIWVLLGYGVAFLGVPLVRYFWLQRQNAKLEARNDVRRDYAMALNEADTHLQQKIRYAQNFASQSVVTADRLSYTTEKDLVEQEIEQADKLDSEWQQRLNRSED
ncbi:MAG: hypothetical protein AAF329_15300 [Cyanobacteria bacterium P01_A01_bin.17]